MTQIRNILMFTGATLGLSTLVACSAGSLPSDQSLNSLEAPAPTYLPLQATVSKTALVTNEAIQIVVSNGKLPYTFASTAGQVNPDVGVFTAPSVATASVTVTVTDALGAKKELSFSVAASTVTQPPVEPPPRPATRVVRRFYNSVHGLHEFTTGVVSGQGWGEESGSYLVFETQQPNTVALRKCQKYTFIPSFIETTDAGCEGQQFTEVLGYVYAGPHEGARPIWRWSALIYGGTLLDHIDMTTNNSVSGYNLDGISFYAPIQ